MKRIIATIILVLVLRSATAEAKPYIMPVPGCRPSIPWCNPKPPCVDGYCG